MSDSDKYNLKWFTFSNHLQSMFKDLYEEGKHCDVTLISDNQTQFKAHKIVLSACSPVFKKIIDNNPSQHPTIYLRGIQSYEIESILQFMYLGEGKFYYERMGEFIKVAKELEVKEIRKDVDIPNLDKLFGEEKITEDEYKDDKPMDVSCNAQETECPECGKGFTLEENMLAHYKSIHEGMRYYCNHCNSKFTHPSNLQKHIQSEHERIRYPCNQCDYQASHRSHLKKHIRSIHEGIKYPCNMCEYQATEKGHLHKHIQWKHNEIKNPCNQCNYEATDPSNLQKHISAKHSENILRCDHCDYRTKWRGDFLKHKKTHVKTL